MAAQKFNVAKRRRNWMECRELRLSWSAGRFICALLVDLH
jgi:hypothetical protein